MRLCAHAQPAHIRMTRRRSVLPSPSSSIPEEDNVNVCSEGNGHDRHGNDPLPIGLTTVVPYQLRSSEVDQCFGSFIPLFGGAAALMLDSLMIPSTGQCGAAGAETQTKYRRRSEGREVACRVSPRQPKRCHGSCPALPASSPSEKTPRAQSRAPDGRRPATSAPAVRHAYARTETLDRPRRIVRRSHPVGGGIRQYPERA